MTTTTMTMTTESAQRHPPRSGFSVRTRIAAAVALLVTAALAGAGAIVHLVESQKILDSVQREVEQELDEFVRLEESGDFTSIPALLEGFLLRNVPDDDELLVGWVDGKPIAQFPEDPLVDDADFLAAAAPLARDGGSTYLHTAGGEVRITSQPVRQGPTSGALLVISYLDEDRGELHSTMRTYTVVAVLAAVLVTAVSAWVSGRLLRPLRTLRLTTENISATDLSRRLPERGNDDITALTRTVNGMLDRLDAAFAGQRQFLDDAGHELRTPLTVLRGHLELLDTAAPDEVAETRTLLIDEVDRMARLVGDLILLAKSDRPDFLAPTEADPSALLASVVTKARALGARDWVLDLSADTLPDELVLDAQRLTQALLALADNAVKHTRDGQRIAVGARVLGTTLRCWVHDSGPGVAPADRDRIFRRFERADLSAHDEGFGLGLSIVDAISQAHGGRAYVDGPVEGGARFVIEIPVVQPQPTPTPTPTPTRQDHRWPAS
ncbi:HAMP domain-containing histidine kinase [Nocardioides caeni]|uniref:histidine kinase n=3 Tax=Nocardioides caeni TaxID=574700 RepID=A0A4S8NLY5_9ACTN|nr:HAMP domain-containing histidine kinase [Nocardioides caeni]